MGYCTFKVNRWTIFVGGDTDNLDWPPRTISKGMATDNIPLSCFLINILLLFRLFNHLFEKVKDSRGAYVNSYIQTTALPIFHSL